VAPVIASLALILASCTSPEEKLIATAEAAVASELRDPTSPLFTEVTATQNGLEVCGYVNGKNGFGAYAGKQRFTYHTASGAEIEPSEDQPGGKFSACMFDHGYRECKGEVLPFATTACGQFLPSRAPVTR
jgi:hypothetical protein